MTGPAQSLVDAVVREILRREACVQAAIDLQVKRILGLGLPHQRCMITACIEPCGEPFETLQYAHNPQGYPRIGFVALRRCPVHPSRVWTPLFGSEQ